MSSPLAFLSPQALPLQSSAFSPNLSRRIASHTNPIPPASFRRRNLLPTCCTPSPVDLDTQFARLSHVNKNLRKKASVAISEEATPETISRLLSLLSLEDTAHRRAAVQTLGMIGSAAVSPVIDYMQQSDNSTVRASCAKALAAVALYFPELRNDFPDSALDSLERALKQDSDPVTKLATVGCLGTLGSDLRKRDDEVIRGNARAVDLLIGLCGVEDMAVGATAVGAIAQIGQNGDEETKQRIVQALQQLITAEGGDGFGYVQEMAKSHLEQLQDGIQGAQQNA